MKPSKALFTQTAVAVAAVTCAPASFAQASVTIYGIVDAGVEYSNAGRGGLVREVAGGAQGNRLGFRGAEDLGRGLSALFRLESGFSADDGTLGQGGRSFGREASVALRSSTLGTVILGRIPLPYYQVLPMIDAFGWVGPGGLLALTRSTPTASRQILPVALTSRLDNSVAYQSPDWGGFTARALVAAGEGSTTVGRAYGASVTYLSGGINVVGAATRLEGANNASSSGNADAFMLGGSYDFTSVKVFAGYIIEKNACATCTGAAARVQGVAGTSASEFRLFNLGARVPFGNFTAVAQATRIEDRSSYAAPTGNRDATVLAIGGEYNLSKRTMLYGGAGTVNNHNGSFYSLGTGSAQQGANAVGGNARAKTVAVGVRHTF